MKIKHLIKKTPILGWIVKKIKNKSFTGIDSFSQSGEDLIINYFFTALKIEKPTWIDIGSFHPEFLSNTALFYKRGSHGINIEADSDSIKLFYSKRKRDVNLNVLISDVNDNIDYYIMDPPVLNTLSKSEMENYIQQGYKLVRTDKKQTKTVSDIINQYSNGIFPDFLSLDAEGYDFEILQSIEWKKSRPKLICVEAMEHSPTLCKPKIQKEILSYLETLDYFIFAQTPNNFIFLDDTFLKGNQDIIKSDTENVLK